MGWQRFYLKWYEQPPPVLANCSKTVGAFEFDCEHQGRVLR
jgi:aspartyl/asparaginyl beta-hydroxylase (cupin superfamily)